MEVKTFDVTLAGEVVKVPCRLKVGQEREVWQAVEAAQDSLVQVCRACKSEMRIDDSELKDEKIKPEHKRVYAVCQNPACRQAGERRAIRFSLSQDIENKQRFVAAATGKPSTWLGTNVETEELNAADAAIKKAWAESGFFGKVQPVKVAMNEPTSDTGDSPSALSSAAGQ